MFSEAHNIRKQKNQCFKSEDLIELFRDSTFPSNQIVRRIKIYLWTQWGIRKDSWGRMRHICCLASEARIKGRNSLTTLMVTKKLQCKHSWNQCCRKNGNISLNRQRQYLCTNFQRNKKLQNFLKIWRIWYSLCTNNTTTLGLGCYYCRKLDTNVNFGNQMAVSFKVVLIIVINEWNNPLCKVWEIPLRYFYSKTTAAPKKW